MHGQRCWTSVSLNRCGRGGAARGRGGLPAAILSEAVRATTKSRAATSGSRDPYNMGVNAEVFLYDPALPPQPKTLMMFYKRLREIDVPEMMASIITETPDKPWGYYRDMTRQLWDEARHAMMGEVGFVAAGHRLAALVMVNFTWSLGLNTQLTPLERHAVLYFIEQGLMPKTGKRFEWEVGGRVRRSACPRCSRITTGPTKCCTRASDATGTSAPLTSPEGGDGLRRPLLVEGADGLAAVEGRRADRAPQLVARRSTAPSCAAPGASSPIPPCSRSTETYETTRADLQKLSPPA